MSKKDPKKVTLGNRIRELREQAQLSREQVADAASVSVRAVVQWELGEREPGWFNIQALCQALGVDCNAFSQPPAPRAHSGPGRTPTATAEMPVPAPQETGKPARGRKGASEGKAGKRGRKKTKD